MSAERRILVAVDLTEHSKTVLVEGLALARALDAEMLVVHVVHRLDAMYGIYLGGGSVTSLQRDIDDTARTQLRDLFQGQVAPADVPARDLLLHGTPWSELLACAAEHHVERIVIGGHVASKPEHQVLGSTVERLLRQARCPVVIVPGTRHA